MLQSASRGRGVGGVCLVRGVCLLGGWCAWSGEGVCLGGGCGGGPGLGGVCSGGGCLLPGRVVGVSQHALRQTPLPPVDRQTLVKILPWPNFVAAGNKLVCCSQSLTKSYPFHQYYVIHNPIKNTQCDRQSFTTHHLKPLFIK